VITLRGKVSVKEEADTAKGFIITLYGDAQHGLEALSFKEDLYRASAGILFFGGYRKIDGTFFSAYQFVRGGLMPRAEEFFYESMAQATIGHHLGSGSPTGKVYQGLATFKQTGSPIGNLAEELGGGLYLLGELGGN